MQRFPAEMGFLSRCRVIVFFQHDLEGFFKKQTSDYAPAFFMFQSLHDGLIKTRPKLPQGAAQDVRLGLIFCLPGWALQGGHMGP